MLAGTLVFGYSLCECRESVAPRREADHAQVAWNGTSEAARLGDVIGQFSQLLYSPKCLQTRKGLCTVAEVLMILKGVACVWTLTVALSLYARARKK
jgi:hypothetical protein